MRVFVAGASGQLGIRLLPRLLARGDAVAGLTRSQPERVALLGAEPIVADVYDLPALHRALATFAPDLVVNALTDLPDDAAALEGARAANARIRDEGARNLLAACAGTPVLATSIAFPPGAEAYERAVLAAGGSVIRFGRWYGPGTWYPARLPPPPRIHVEEAALRLLDALDAPPGSVLEFVDAPAGQRLPVAGPGRGKRA